MASLTLHFGVLLSHQSDLNISYLQEWATKLEVSDLLERALDEMSSSQE